MKSAKVLPELNWKKKFRKVSCIVDNVSVSIISAGKTAKATTKLLSLTIRDNLFQQFGSDYIAVAVAKNRLYFKGTVADEGYKLTTKNTSAYMQATIHGDEIAVYEQFVGSYSLKYDEFYELYYIERED